MNSYDQLVTAWREATDAWRLDVPGSSRTLPGDEDALALLPSGVRFEGTLAEYQAMNPVPADAVRALHTSLLPVPYLGNIKDAAVYILMLNPGFGPGNYFMRDNDPDNTRRDIANLRQEIPRGDYPFMCLNPAANHTGGFAYWGKQAKFGWMIEALKDAPHNMSSRDALSFIADHVAVLQWMPYPSERFGMPSKVTSRLESTRLIREFVRDRVQARALDGQSVVISARKVKEWGLSEDDPGVLKGSHLRGDFGPNSAQGQAIFAKLKERLP